MTTFLQMIADKLSSRISPQNFSGSLKIKITHEGSLFIDHDGISISDKSADCTLEASEDVFESIITKDITPTAAFMTGALKISGDISLAMQLANALSEK